MFTIRGILHIIIVVWLLQIVLKLVKGMLAKLK